MRWTLTVLMLFYAGIGNATDQAKETSPCPGLVASYDTESFERLLVVTDAEFASIEDCERLGRFFFEPAQALGRRLDFAQLGAIVDGIWRPANEETPRVLLEAMLSWLRGLGFDRHAASLKEFLDTYLPAGESVRLFFTILIWLIVIATATLVAREFYKAGLFTRRRRGRHRREPDAAGGPVLQWNEILSLPPREQISVLLKHSLERLASAGRIPVSHSYTNRELVEYLQAGDDARTAGLLRAQVELTEPVIYGDEHISDEHLAACRKCSRELAGA